MAQRRRRFFQVVDGAVVAAAGSESGHAGAQPHSGPGTGEILRETRLAQGMELRDVASTLKIRYVFMEAIEQGRYAELPGTAYAIGFIRAYADFLGLDSVRVVERFKEEIAGRAGKSQLYFPTPVPEGRVPGGTILLIGLVAAVLVYGSWYIVSTTDRSLVNAVPTLPQRLISLLDFIPHGSGSASHPAPAAAPTPPPAPPGPAAGNGAAPALEPGPGGILVPAPPPAGAGAGASGLPAPLPLGAPLTPQPLPAPLLPAALAPTPAPTPAQAAAAADDAEEFPLVSGPADEPETGPGPLVPMIPRGKPLLRPAAPPAEPPAAAVPPAAAPAAAPPPSAIPAAGTPAAGAPPAGNSPAGTPVSEIPAPPPADPGANAGRVFGSMNRDSRVQLRALQDTWIQVRDGDGDPIFTRMLRAGDIFRVPDRDGMRLRTGNAGGLAVVVDGAEQPPLGPAGQVLRDLPIEASRFQRSAH